MNLKEQLNHANKMGYITVGEFDILNRDIEAGKDENQIMVDLHLTIRQRNLMTYQKFTIEIHKEVK